MDTLHNTQPPGDGPGQSHFKVPMNDLEPPAQTQKVVGGILLGAIGLAGIVWGWLLLANDRPAFIILLLALLFLSLSLTSLLSRFVHTPV